MVQIVRRRPEAAAFAGKTEQMVSRKERRLEFALVSLVSANLFLISSMAALYFLAHGS